MEKEVYEALISLNPKERALMARKLAGHYNCSVSTIWRVANKAGIRSRSPRSDKGKTKASEDTLKHIAGLIYTSGSLNGKFTFEVKEIIKHLEQDFGQVIELSYPRICELLRQRGYTMKEFRKPTPHKQLLSEYPNHAHQFDVSICSQWYFDEKVGEICERDTVRTHYKNKMEQTVEAQYKGKNKIYRYILVDHCSGAFFLHYYYDLGENSVSGSNFLFKSWSGKKELIDPTLKTNYLGAYMFQGLPEILITDNGALVRNKEVRNLLESLKITVKLHAPGNPRAKGMVEGLMWIVEKKFESRLRICSMKNIDELNAHALKWCVEYNIDKSFRRVENIHYSRADIWRKIKQENFRKCVSADIWAMLLQSDEITRNVDGNGRIDFKGRKYTVTNPNICHNKVIIKINAFEYPSINVHHNGEVYTIEPDTVDEFGRSISPNSVTIGTHRSLKNTDTQNFKNEAAKFMKETYGIEEAGKGYRKHFTPSAKPSPEAKLTPSNVAYITPKGNKTPVNPHKPVTTPLPKLLKITQQASEHLVPLTETLRAYTMEYGRITPEERDKLTAAYPNGTPVTLTADDIYAFLTTPTNVVKLA